MLRYHATKLVFIASQLNGCLITMMLHIN